MFTFDSLNSFEEWAEHKSLCSQMETLVEMNERHMHEVMAFHHANRMDAMHIVESLTGSLVDAHVAGLLSEPDYIAIYHVLDRVAMHLRISDGKRGEFPFTESRVPYLPKMTKTWCKENAEYLNSK